MEAEETERTVGGTELLSMFSGFKIFFINKYFSPNKIQCKIPAYESDKNIILLGDIYFVISSLWQFQNQLVRTISRY